MPPKPKEKQKENSPFKIAPEAALCGSFVKDPRYNALYKHIMANRASWIDPNPVTAGLKIFEFMESLGNQAQYVLLAPLKEPDNLSSSEMDLDGFPK